MAAANAPITMKEALTRASAKKKASSTCCVELKSAQREMLNFETVVVVTARSSGSNIQGRGSVTVESFTGVQGRGDVQME
ncbi:hypothetical protein DKX38_025050 [Salix brachista]|uniref:Uncharacterized protein n=1 Tax=Salix brachista TaxID=2182728 RepID=A0A5N5JMY4_9ROSI|nr:hypothetical protein DKX38_025050 [Salix brachista]